MELKDFLDKLKEEFKNDGRVRDVYVNMNVIPRGNRLIVVKGKKKGINLNFSIIRNRGRQDQDSRDFNGWESCDSWY